MKRQRSEQGSGTTRLQTAKVTIATRRKKAKTRIGQGKEELVVAAAADVLVGNQLRDDREFADMVKAEEEMVKWDEWWPCSWVAVDEQMSWGTCWSPSWDMDFIDGEAYHALYNDVVWEDDIWDLKDIKNVPSSLSSP